MVQKKYLHRYTRRGNASHKPVRESRACLQIYCQIIAFRTVLGCLLKLRRVISPSRSILFTSWHHICRSPGSSFPVAQPFSLWCQCLQLLILSFSAFTLAFSFSLPPGGPTLLSSGLCSLNHRLEIFFFFDISCQHLTGDV